MNFYKVILKNGKEVTILQDMYETIINSACIERTQFDLRVKNSSGRDVAYVFIIGSEIAAIKPIAKEEKVDDKKYFTINLDRFDYGTGTTFVVPPQMGITYVDC